ncbi:hypothetical protein ACJ41O_012223 [Fusarium nematophilum]
MEAAGLEAGLVGIVSNIKSCIDVWESMANATRVSKEFDTFVLNLQIEMTKFLLWCQITGLLRMAHQIETGTSQPPTGSIADLFVQGHFPPFILSRIQVIIGQLKDTLKATAKLPRSNLSSDIPRTYHEVIRRMAHDTQMVIAQVSRLSEEVMDGEKRLWKLENRAGRKRRLSNDSKTARMLQNVTRCNTDLVHVLQLLDGLKAERLARWVDTHITATPMCRVVMEAHRLAGSDGELPPPNPRWLQLSQISERGSMMIRLEDGDGNLQATFGSEPETSSNRQTLARQMQSLTLGDSQGIRIDQTNLRFTSTSDSSSTPERQFGSCQGNQVLIEWRYVSTRPPADGRSLVNSQVVALATQLKESSTIPQFRLPSFLGYLESTSESKFGLVFQVPSNSMPKTLRDYLYDDYKHGTRRSLESRLYLAKQLVVTVFHFFSVHWFHRNIRPSNILFFDEPRTNSLPQPRLAGFGHVSSVTLSREWRLYSHPLQDQMLMSKLSASPKSNLMLSNMQFDAYSLGIILIEIALWTPVIKLCSRDKTVEYFQGYVTCKQLEQHLIFQIGEKYARVVHRLLKGEFDLKTEDGQGHDKGAFLGAFERTIVNEM